MRGERRWRRVAPAAAALASALAAGACSLGLPSTPDSIYDLTAPEPDTRGMTNAQILVPEPVALKALDSERIAARPTETEYAYLPGALWSDRLPRLLQARLLETLQDAKGMKAVGLPGQGLSINYQVILEVRHFEITDGGGRAEFNVKLLDDTNGRVVASQVFAATSPVVGAGNAGSVAALDAAMDEAFVAITRWVAAKV